MIQPQLYGISWARLLFGRVYVVTGGLLYQLWDYLFESQQQSTLSADNVSERNESENENNSLRKLSGYDIRDPLLLKLASFILALVLEVLCSSCSSSSSPSSSYALRQLTPMTSFVKIYWQVMK